MKTIVALVLLLASIFPLQAEAAEPQLSVCQAVQLAEKHLQEKGGPKQPPQVPPHVVGPDGEEKRGPNAARLQQAAQVRNADPGAAIGIDVDPQAGFHRRPAARTRPGLARE